MPHNDHNDRTQDLQSWCSWGISPILLGNMVTLANGEWFRIIFSLESTLRSNPTSIHTKIPQWVFAFSWKTMTEKNSQRCSQLPKSQTNPRTFSAKAAKTDASRLFIAVLVWFFGSWLDYLLITWDWIFWGWGRLWLNTMLLHNCSSPLLPQVVSLIVNLLRKLCRCSNYAELSTTILDYTWLRCEARFHSNAGSANTRESISGAPV